MPHARQPFGARGVGQLRSIFTVLITSLTTPHSGRLRRAASASASTMVMSFSAHGIGFSSGRVASDQLPALLSSKAARKTSRSTPRLLGELEAFLVGRDAGPQDQIVDHLADLAGAERAEVKHRVGKGRECRPAGVEDGLVAAAHDQELALLRRALAAAERNVEQRNRRPGRKFCGNLLHGGRRDGRGDRDDAAVARAGEHAAVSPNITASTSASKPTATMTRSLAAATACGELTGCTPNSAAASMASASTS